MKRLLSLLLIAVLLAGFVSFVHADDSVNVNTGVGTDKGSVSASADTNASYNQSSSGQVQSQDRENEMNQSQSDIQERLMHPLNDGGQSEYENESVYSYRSEDGVRNQITVRARVGNDGEVENEVEMHGYNVSVSPGLGVNFSGYRNGSGVMMRARLLDGQEKEVKILPDVASQTAISRFQSKNITVVLKQVGNGTNAGVVYEASANKTVALLGLFKVRAILQAEINATNGEVMKYNQPWWYFLAFGGSGAPKEYSNGTANESVNATNESAGVVGSKGNVTVNATNASTVNGSIVVYDNATGGRNETIINNYEPNGSKL